MPDIIFVEVDVPKGKQEGIMREIKSCMKQGSHGPADLYGTAGSATEHLIIDCSQNISTIIMMPTLLTLRHLSSPDIMKYTTLLLSHQAQEVQNIRLMSAEAASKKASW